MHEKNIAMDKQNCKSAKAKVHTTSSMKQKGYSSSSHYRIKSVVGVRGVVALITLS